MEKELENLLFKVKSNQEKLIIEQLLNNFENISSMTLEEIAERSFCSKTSVRRVIIKLGYKGYLEYQLHVKLYLAEKGNEDKENCPILEENFKSFLEFINSNKYISIYGTDYDTIPAQYLFRQLLELGYKVTLITDHDLIYNVKNDGVIIVSNSMQNANIVKNVRYLKKIQNCNVAAITVENSDLLKYVDVSLVHGLENSTNKKDTIDACILINKITKKL